MLKKYQHILILLLVCAWAINATGCKKKVQPIAFEDVSSFVLLIVETGQEVYCGEAGVHSFIDAYNESEYFRDDYGTTHPLRVDILFSDHSTLKVWGGVQGFQTQVLDGKQHNLKSDTLDEWFADRDIVR